MGPVPKHLLHTVFQWQVQIPAPQDAEQDKAAPRAEHPDQPPAAAGAKKSYDAFPDMG